MSDDIPAPAFDADLFITEEQFITENVDAFLSEAYSALDIIESDHATTGTIGEYAQRLDMLRRIIALATELRNAIELAIAEAMPENRMVEGGLRISRERSSRSYWRDADSSERMREAIEQQVATTLALDVGTGEIDPVRKNLISYAIHQLWDVLPAPSTLKAGARKYGINLRDFREFQPGFTIRITPVEETE